MPAEIQSLVNGINPIAGQSRDDLRESDLITLNDVGGPGTSWAWSIVYAPQDKDRNPSAAALAGNVNGPGPVSFTVDNEGAYLIRLAKDVGLPSESVQYVRLRYLTKFNDLSLVAAGERRDGTGVIPVDVSAQGWADDQNYNLNVLNCAIRKISASGRILYVDANRGPDSTQPPNDPSVAEGYADYSSINDAIVAAYDPSVNKTLVPTADNPYIVAVRPGVYEEALVSQPFVHIVALPSASGTLQEAEIGDRTVVVVTPSAGASTHTVTLPGANDFAIFKGIRLENNKATTNAVLRKTGPGNLGLVDTQIVQRSNDPSDGPSLSVEQGGVYGQDTYLTNLNTDPGALALSVSPSGPNTATVVFENGRMTASSVATLNENVVAGVSARFRRVSMASTSISPLAHGLDTNAETTIVEYCEGHLVNGQPDFVRVNPTQSGAPGDVSLGVYYSRIGMPMQSPRQGILFDTTGLAGTNLFEAGASEYSGLNLIGPNPLTQRATVNSKSLAYDNTLSGLTAENVQDAIDEIAAGAIAPSLDEAYNNGRTITVDAGAVELQGPGPIADPPPLSPGNGDGSLNVYQEIAVGAIPDTEILIASNNFGLGPSVEMGHLVRTTDSVFGSSAHVIANAFGDADYYNYNLRLVAADAAGNTLIDPKLTMGNVVIQAGSALCGSGVNAPDGGSVYMMAGGVEENLGGSGGNLWLVPGTTGAGASGALNLVNPDAATGATLTANANFVDAAATPAGTLTFATSSGKVEVTFAGGENFASIQSLLSTGTGIQATWAGAGNPIVLTTAVTGPSAELMQVDDSTAGALTAYLGDFTVTGGAIFVPGTYPEYVSLSSNANQTIVIGNGVNDMVYDAVTGKLTVPGSIDPTDMVFDFFGEASVTTGPGKGAIFVSDGSGGAANAGNLYFKDAAGALTDLLAGGGGGAPAAATYLTFGAEGALPNSRQLLEVAGQITLTDSGPGTNVAVGLANTGVVPGAYTRINATVDAKGRLTAVASSSVQDQIHNRFVVPAGGGGGLFPFEIDEYDIQVVNTGMTLDGLLTGGTFFIYLAQAFGYGGGGQCEVQVSVATPPGPFVDLFTVPVDISLLPANTLLTIGPGQYNVGLPYTIAAGDVIRTRVTFNSDPVTGDGLVVALSAQT